MAAIARRARRSRPETPGPSQHVGDVDDRAAQDSPADATSRLGRHRKCAAAPRGLRRAAVVAARWRARRRTDRRRRAAPHSRTALSSDGVEDRLDVGRRARDHPQDLGRGRLLLQRLFRSRLNRRTFSMAMTAWAAKVSRSAICRSVNGRPRSRRSEIAPIGVALAEQRDAEDRCGSRRCRACALLSGTRPAQPGCRATWTVRRSSTARPVAGPRSSGTEYAPTRPARIGTVMATRRSRSPSSGRCRSVALAQPGGARAMASKTGWTSVGELEMTRRISAVAVCCSSASVSGAREPFDLGSFRSAYDGAGRMLAP